MFELVINCNKQNRIILEEILFAKEAISVSYNVSDNTITAHFNNNPKDLINYDDFHIVTINEIKDNLYDEKWLDYFESTSINEFEIVSEHKHQNLQENLIVLKMNNAFGSGLHPSTISAANLLNKLKLNSSINILDIGSGTGILSILAYKKFNSKIVAIDIDKKSYESTKYNFENNKLKGYKCLCSDIKYYKNNYKFDLIIANLLWEIHEKNIQIYKNLIKLNSKIIISGFTKKWKSDINKKFSSYGFVYENELEINGWIAIVYRSI